MPGEAAKKQKQTEPGSQQEERRQDERRQNEQDPQQERRRDERRQGPGSANTTMRAEEQSEYGQEPSRQKWQGENVQSGTSQAQKGEGRTPDQQAAPAERHEQNYERGGTEETRERGAAGQEFGPGGQTRSGSSESRQGAGSRAGEQEHRERSSQDFGESRDPAFGEGGRGAGGKIDSTQRDMGQTGQSMRTGTSKSGEHTHAAQQGPYGPSEKHRGPEASGKPLMDDWGKSDKH